MKSVSVVLVIAMTARATLAKIPMTFGMGDLSDAMGSPVGGSLEPIDPDQFFEPQGTSLPDGQQLPEQLSAIPGDGFEASDFEIDCGEHGCASPVSAVTVFSQTGGTRSETTDRTTSLTRSPSSIGVLWTLQQAPNSCSLSWFNASWPLVSSYEVQSQVYGIESCVQSKGTVWMGLFQFEVCSLFQLNLATSHDSSAVDVLFENICEGEIDLRWTLLGEHVERIAPNKMLNPVSTANEQILVVPNLELGPTETASAAVAARKTLEASGTVFMVVRNGCSGPATLEVKQALMARVELSLAHTFDIMDAVIVALVVGASAMFVYSAVLLCQAMQTLDDIEERDAEGNEILAKVSSLPSKVLIERTSSADEPLLKAHK